MTSIFFFFISALIAVLVFVLLGVAGPSEKESDKTKSGDADPPGQNGPDNPPAGVKANDAKAKKLLTDNKIANAVLAALMVLVFFVVLPATHLWLIGWMPSETKVVGVQDYIFGAIGSYIVFGALFGIFIAYWGVEVYHRETNRDVSRRELYYAAIMIALLFLGLGGLDRVFSAVERLSGIKVAGIEASFFTPSTQSASPKALAATMPSDGNQNLSSRNSARNPDLSNGFAYLHQLKNMMERDKDYFIILSIQRMQESPKKAVGTNEVVTGEFLGNLIQITKGMDEGITFVSKHFSPIIDCVSWISEKSNNPNYTSRLLTDMGIAISGLFAVSESQSNIEALSEKIAARWRGSVNHFFKTLGSQAGWVTLIKEQGNGIGKKKGGSKKGNGEKENSCSKFLVDTKESSKNVKDDSLAEHLKKEPWKSRPYLSIALASVKATSGNYVGAVDVLDKWLRSQKAIQEDGTKETYGLRDVLSIVYEIRVRSLMAGILEEWMRNSGEKLNQNVVEYYIQNSHTLVNLVRKQRFVAEAISRFGVLPDPMALSGFRMEPDFRNGCKNIHEIEALTSRLANLKVGEAKDKANGKAGSQTEKNFIKSAKLLKAKYAHGKQSKPLAFSKATYHLLTLVDTVFANQTLYAYYALEHLRYHRRYSGTATNYIESILKQDLSCLSDLTRNSGLRPSVRRAEALGLHARILMKDVERWSGVYSKQKSREKREEALAAIASGLRLVELYKETKSAQAKSFREQIAPSRINDSELTLTQLQRRIRAFKVP